MAVKKRDKCEICGKSLVYVTKTEDCKEINCAFCGKKFNTNIFCEDGHYICDECHSGDPVKFIGEYCENTKIKDPFEIANQIMKHPNFKMYGPEHHALTPAVILTALRNNNIKKPNGDLISILDIKEAIKRASKIPGGWCGFYGSCGSGIGSGVAISVFTAATPSTDKERSLANKMTARSLSKIADDLEHCCKRSVKLTICETLNFLKDNFGVILNYQPDKCEFSKQNDKCEHENCQFF